MEQENTGAARFMQALRRMDGSCRRAGRVGGLPRGSLEVLLAIHAYSCHHDGAPLRVGALSDRMEQSAPAISRWVGDLEDRGLLRRFAGDDRRTVCVELTDGGRALLDRGRSQLLGAVALMLEELGPEDGERLIALMERADGLFRAAWTGGETAPENGGCR